jgi:flagellar hook-length control protein FliK
MTDALPPALMPPLPVLPPGGLATPARGPDLPGQLPGKAVEIPGLDAETDAFSLILNGFFGAALPQPGTGSAPGAPPAGPAFGAPAPVVATPLPPALPPAPPPPDGAGAEALAASIPAGQTGKPLPLPGEALPGTAATDGLALDPPDPSAPGADATGQLPGTATQDTSPANTAAGDAGRSRALSADTLLAQLAFSRNALRGQQALPATAAEGAAAPLDLAVGDAAAVELPVGQASAAFPPVMAPAGATSTQAGLLANASPAAAVAGGQGSPAAAGQALAPLADAGSFADGLGERLLALGGDGLQTARLRLHPETLGPLEVRIRVDGGQADVWFGTQQGQARDAIEGTLPRLREMFAAQGLELGRVQVELRPEPAPGSPGGWQGAGAAFANDRQPSRQPEPRADGLAGAAPRPWAEAPGRAVGSTGRSERLVDVLA